MFLFYISVSPAVPIPTDLVISIYSKICVNGHSQKDQGQLSLNAGKKYCRIFQWEHSAILSTFIKVPFVIKIFILSIFEWPFYTDFTVSLMLSY